MEFFFRHGPVIYLSFLIAGVGTTVASITTQLPVLLLGLSLLYLAGNVKFAHGILFNEGLLKRYNQGVGLGFNLAFVYTLLEYF